MNRDPLVTVMIATKDRPCDLKQTLAALRQQSYPRLELLVLDDGSATPIEPLVRSCWPDAEVVRCEQSAGQSLRRTEGLRRAHGDYILQLDDDSYPVVSDGIARAVQVIEAHPEVGALALRIHNGPAVPAELPFSPARYTVGFVGCGVLFRRAAVSGLAYRDFFQNEWEEEDFARQLLAAGWAIRFTPEVVIHHHVSTRNRNSARTWMRGLRNKLWGHVMHLPAHRVPVEMAWTLGMGLFDSLRLLRPHRLVQALALFVAGLPRAVRLRQPMTAKCLRRYDTLRFGPLLLSLAEWQDPPACGWKDIWQWFRSTWRHRARNRSVWDPRPGDVGRSDFVTFAHEFTRRGKSGPR